MLGDILVFNDVPVRRQVVLISEFGLCPQAPVSLRLGKTHWIFQDVEVGNCSDLTVAVEGLPDPAVRPDLLIRAVDDAGAPGEIIDSVNRSASARFGNLPPAVYAIDVRFSQGEAAFTTTDMVSVGGEASIVHVVTIRAVTLHGRISWGREVPTGQLRLRLKTETRRATIETPITSEGEYRVLLPQPGRYWASLKNTDLRASPADIVEVPPGEDSEIDIHFPRTRLSGVVSIESGTPVAGAAVVARVERDDGAERTEVTTDSAGNFQYDGLGPGRLTLEASKTGYRQKTPIVGVTLSEDTELEEQVILEKMKGARVTVRDPDEAPRADLRVFCASVATPGDYEYLGATDGNGEIELDTEGRLPMRCTVPSRIAALDTYALTSNEPVTWTLTRPVGAILVTVLDEQERPLSGVPIYVVSEGSFLGIEPLALQAALRSGSDVTSAAGVAYLPGLRPGRTEVFVGMDPDSWKAAAFGGGDTATVEFSLAPGERHALVLHVFSSETKTPKLPYGRETRVTAVREKCR